MTNSIAIKQIAQMLTDRNIQHEYLFSASRSGGAGGQNVNKVNTKVELRFCIGKSVVLTDDEKEKILTALAGKLNTEGELIITSTQTRSQLKNKVLCVEKLTAMLAAPLVEKVERVDTKPSRAAKEKRLAAKRQHSEIKQGRKRVDV